MGRSVYCDDVAQAYIDSLIKKGRWHIGLIIGQLSLQKDYVVRLARTPEAKEDEVCEVSELWEEEELPSIRKTPKPPPQSLELADDVWVSTHAKQVTRMLPGGLDVIGIFVVARTSILKDAQSKLRQMLFAVHKSVMKNVAVVSPNAIMDRIILQVDSLTSKIVCSSLDVSNVKNSPRPAEWRYSNATRWLRLESAVAVDVLMPVTSDTRSHQTMLKTIQNVIAPFCQELMNSVTLVSGEVRDPAEMLATYPEGGKKGKGKDKNVDVNVNNTYHVDFLLPMRGDGEPTEAVMSEVQKLMSVRGIITCRAFVHWKASVNEAVQAIKTDVVRSLSSRCELLSEDLELTDELTSMELKQLYDTPVRVFSAANKAGAQVCDYMFQDEKKEEVMDRMRELLDMKIMAADLEMSCERPARENDWVTASHSEHSLSTLVDTPNPTPGKFSLSFYLSLSLSALLALLAALASFFFREQ